MANLLIVGVQCRLCNAVISQAELSLANRLYTEPLGNEANGYVCWKCHNDGAEKFAKLQSSVAAFWTTYTDVSSIDSPPCAICGTMQGEWRLGPLEIDNACGFICLDCEPRYLLALRSQIHGTKLEFDLKLR